MECFEENSSRPLFTTIMSKRIFERPAETKESDYPQQSPKRIRARSPWVRLPCRPPRLLELGFRKFKLKTRVKNQTDVSSNLNFKRPSDSEVFHSLLLTGDLGTLGRIRKQLDPVQSLKIFSIFIKAKLRKGEYRRNVNENLIQNEILSVDT